MSTNLTDRHQDIDRLAHTLVAQGHDPITDLFIHAGARPPTIIWSPKRAELRLDRLEVFADYVMGLPQINGLPAASAFNIDDIGPLQRWLMLLDVQDRSLTYVHYGRGITDHYGRDMTGGSVFDFAGHISRFFAAIYHASILRREPVLSEHDPPADVFVRSWRRYLVPLVDEHGTVIRFAGCNIPESPLRAGLDILTVPAFVFDVHFVLRFANQAAGEFFNWQLVPTNVSLRQLFGDDLAQSLNDLPTDQVVLRRKLQLDGRQRRQFEINAGYVTHAGHPLWIVTLRDITKQLKDERKIKRLAETDPLTGLANRRLFDRRLTELLADSERPFTLFLIDLDGFKRVNDQHGHMMGDALLVAVGRRLKRRCRKSACVARIGGDEFAILLTEVKTPEQATSRAEGLMQAFDEPFQLGALTINAAASIGCASVPKEAQDRLDLMNVADRRLYEMKLSTKS